MPTTSKGMREDVGGRGGGDGGEMSNSVESATWNRGRATHIWCAASLAPWVAVCGCMILEGAHWRSGLSIGLQLLAQEGSEQLQHITHGSYT